MRWVQPVEGVHAQADRPGGERLAVDDQLVLIGPKGLAGGDEPLVGQPEWPRACVQGNRDDRRPVHPEPDGPSAEGVTLRPGQERQDPIAPLRHLGQLARRVNSTEPPADVEHRLASRGQGLGSNRTAASRDEQCRDHRQ